MKPTALLLGLALLSVPVTAALAQSPDSSAVITANRVGDGCDITLPAAVAKTLTDQIWLVVDGKSEGFGSGSYNTDITLRPLHYTANISDDLDGQMKDILKAQGVPIKADVTTYRITYGVNAPVSSSVSKSLTFRHESNILAYTPLPETAAYKVGDKITIYEGVALDSSMSTSGILGSSIKKQDQVPRDLLHRITIQVQFVPKSAK